MTLLLYFFPLRLLCLENQSLNLNWHSHQLQHGYHLASSILIHPKHNFLNCITAAIGQKLKTPHLFNQRLNKISSYHGKQFSLYFWFFLYFEAHILQLFKACYAHFHDDLYHLCPCLDIKAASTISTSIIHSKLLLECVWNDIWKPCWISGGIVIRLRNKPPCLMIIGFII